MRYRRLSTLLLCVLPAAAETCPAPASTGYKDAVPLCAAIAQVTSALNRYQSSLGSVTDGSGGYALPPLAKAEFDFKTTAGATAGAKIGLFVLTIGASRTNEVTNDVVFTYAWKLPPKPAPLLPHTAPTLEDQLYATIRGAAEQLRMAPKVAGVPFANLMITVQFCVKWDGGAGVNAPVSLVTVGLNGEKNRAATQSVKLTFARP